MARVWKDYPGTGGSELLVLLALADWSDDDGRCWPSMSSIANKVRLSESQARRVVHGLIADGYLVVLGNANGGSPGASRQYQLVLSALTGRIHATPSVDATPGADARDPWRGCAPTPSAGATRTIIEPSVNTKEKSKRQKPLVSDLPDCPFSEIIAAYHEALPNLPQVRLETDDRKAAMRKLWVWLLTSKADDGDLRCQDAEQAMAWVRAYFAQAGQNDFLMGRTQRSSEHSAWVADFDFLLSRKGMKHVIEKTVVREVT